MTNIWRAAHRMYALSATASPWRSHQQLAQWLQGNCLPLNISVADHPHVVLPKGQDRWVSWKPTTAAGFELCFTGSQTENNIYLYNQHVLYIYYIYIVNNKLQCPMVLHGNVGTHLTSSHTWCWVMTRHLAAEVGWRNVYSVWGTRPEERRSRTWAEPEVSTEIGRGEAEEEFETWMSNLKVWVPGGIWG